MSPNGAHTIRPFTVRPIGIVRSSRKTPTDDNWDAETASIEIDPMQFPAEALKGLDQFSHVEVIYLFDQVAEDQVESSARHPRGNKNWPEIGIFAQRGKARPNRIGVTVSRVKKLDGHHLQVEGLDAIDGTPVLDIKPVMEGFLPRGGFFEPDWAKELMEGYWRK